MTNGGCCACCGHLCRSQWVDLLGLRDVASNLGTSLDPAETTLLCPLVLGWLRRWRVQERSEVLERC